MSNFPTKKQVNVAVANRNQHDLTRTHITTQDFGRIKPIECRYMVPGDNFNYKVSSFTRLLPMYAPTFGKIDHIQRAFFVPIRTIFPHFYDFLRDRPTSDGDGGYNAYPYCTSMGDLFRALLKQQYAELVSPAVTTTPPALGEYDFVLDTNLVYGSITWENGWYRWTTQGRRIYDFFVSLGLNICSDSKYRNTKISLLPVLAFWKAYYDWIVPSRFIQDDDTNIYHLLHQIFNFTSSQTASVEDISKYLLKVPVSFYKDDYFTSAWKKPFEADEEPAFGLTLNNPAASASLSILPVDSTSEAGSFFDSSISDGLNQYTIESLGKLQDYLNRGMLAGSKIQDWLAVEFGMRPNSDAIGLSTYLGKSEEVIRIGDVMSTADTQNGDVGVPLGSYAGMGKGDNVAKFSFSAKGEDHGFFIIITELIPNTSYFQGLNPEFQLLDRLDFFQPEFDNMGVEPIQMKDLFCSPQKFVSWSQMHQVEPDAVFGFAPQYSRLKWAADSISGDFRNRFGEILKPWYLARDVEKWLRANHALGTDYINKEFCEVISAYQNWDNIFVGDDNSLDHFYSIYLIENKAQRPMISISEALNPEHPNGTKEVTVNTNGGIE